MRLFFLIARSRVMDGYLSLRMGITVICPRATIARAIHCNSVMIVHATTTATHQMLLHRNGLCRRLEQPQEHHLQFQDLVVGRKRVRPSKFFQQTPASRARIATGTVGEHIAVQRHVFRDNSRTHAGVVGIRCDWIWICSGRGGSCATFRRWRSAARAGPTSTAAHFVFYIIKMKNTHAKVRN